MGYFLPCNAADPFCKAPTRPSDTLTNLGQRRVIRLRSPYYTPHRASIAIIIIIITTVPSTSSTKLSSNPMLMVRAHISVPTDTQLTGHIDISLTVGGTRFTDLLDGVLIALPRGTAVNALYLTRLASSPLLKAGSVDVLSACTFAPEDVVWLVRLIKLHNTNRAVSFNGLTRTACVSLLGCCCIQRESSNRRVCEDLSKLSGEKCDLVG